MGHENGPRLLVVCLAAALAVAQFTTAALPLAADDTDLFRLNSGKPYLFIFFDTSSSMNLGPPAQLSLPANGDDPQSTLYIAKRVAYEVFHDAFLLFGDRIHYGFASYNQDEMRVRGKHWTYRVVGGSPLNIGGSLYPVVGEELVFGAHFPAGTLGRTPTDETALAYGLVGGGGGSAGAEGPEQGAVNGLSVPVAGQLGDCAAPANLENHRVHINRFAKLSPNVNDGFGNVAGVAPSVLYVRSGGTTYRLEVSQAGGPWVSADTITVEFDLFDCAGSPLGSTEITLAKGREFLYHEQIDPAPLNLKQNKHEMTDGFWDYQAIEAIATCGDDDTPHTGRGWEGNYDGYFDTTVNPVSGQLELDSFRTADCDPSLTQVECNLKQTTEVHANPEAAWRTQDLGDMIPFSWENSNREDLFRRLAPNWDGTLSLLDLDFGVAAYFTDVPEADGYLRLRNPNHKPLPPYGGSPIGDSLSDWRCFYLGQDGGGHKCHQNEQPFGDGFDDLAAQFDGEWGCRQIYQIIIGDGENNCVGENPAADTANLRRNRVQSWVINFGGPESDDLERLARNTGGEYIEAANGQELKDELARIVGVILEDTRQFASAAVPAVQADDADKVFASSFKPINDPSAGTWPGRVDAFLKPVPLLTDGTPDTSFKCSADPGTAPRANCHLWEVGEELVEQTQPIGSQLGLGEDQRRVFYSLAGEPGQGPSLRRLLEPTSPSDPDSVRYDLWRTFDLIPDLTLDGSLLPFLEAPIEDAANAAIEEFYALKVTDLGNADPSDDLTYVLGDVFHSDPLVVDQPEGVTYFRRNLFHDRDLDCDEGNPGYRCFFFKHQNRRKVLFFGANDGTLHAVDAGIHRNEGPFSEPLPRYDDGTGREIFAWAPRPALPILYSVNSGGVRLWSVDASPNASDVFIDPLDDGGVFPDPDEREWRTVLLTGMRRGGRGYTALDITQPDTYDEDGQPEPLGGSTGYVPSCMGIGGLDPDCGPVPYATPLWEFADAALVPGIPGLSPFRLVGLDEDLNGVPDLGSSWSDPVPGLVRLCTGDNCDPSAQENDVETFSVVVFGGGFNSLNNAGHFLYMVDVETGEAVYKEPLCHSGTLGALCLLAGSAPAGPAVVDTDRDGYIDRIYIGTRGGIMFRADLRGPNGEVPRLLDDRPVIDLDGVLHLVRRIDDSAYAPREIFRASPAGLLPIQSRQVFYRPAVGFLSDLGQYAIAFGTGNREDLFIFDNQPGRFYVFRDDIEVGDHATRYSEDDLTFVVDGDPALGGDTLSESSPTQGWFLETRANDRLIAAPFQIAGITVFTMFQPDVLVSVGGPGGGTSVDLCSRTGTSRVFAVNTRNADGLLFTSGVRTRGLDIAGFVVSPSRERAGTQNVYDPEDPSSGSTRPDDPDDPDDDQFNIACEDEQDCLLALAEMKKLMPENCKYSSQRHNLPLTTDQLVKVGEIPIPICIIDKNWVEL